MIDLFIDLRKTGCGIHELVGDADLDANRRGLENGRKDHIAKPGVVADVVPHVVLVRLYSAYQIRPLESLPGNRSGIAGADGKQHACDCRAGLDAGSRGACCEYLAKLGRYRGVDIDPENVASSAQRFPGRSFQLADICSEQFRSDYPPGSVDTVVCCNVIEHIADDRRAVSNLANALSPGGHLLLLVPAHQRLYGDLDRLAGHCRRYNKRLMLNACSDSPVDILELRYFNPVGGLAWWINSFAQHRSLDDSAVNAQIRIFDKYIVPMSRLVDPVTRGFFGQSLICVARKR